MWCSCPHCGASILADAAVDLVQCHQCGAMLQTPKRALPMPSPPPVESPAAFTQSVALPPVRSSRPPIVPKPQIIAGKFCSSCGSPLLAQAVICPQCGCEQADQVLRRQEMSGSRKDPGIAALLSFLWMGAGQIYNGDLAKGIVFAILPIFWPLALFALIGIPIMLGLWIWAIVDAYQSAKNANWRSQHYRRY